MQPILLFVLNNTGNGEVQAGCTSVGGYIGTNSNHPFFLRSNSTEQVTVLANGNIGVGTTTPDEKVVIVGSVGQIKAKSSGAEIEFTRAGGSFITASNATGYLGFQTGGLNQRVNILANGRVTINEISSTVCNGLLVTGYSDSTTNYLNGDAEILIRSTNGKGPVLKFEQPISGAATSNTAIVWGSGQALEMRARENLVATFTSARNLAFPNGQGIDFSASESATATSSLLDDYEEGIFETTFTDSLGGALSVSPSNNLLQYVKIGNMVFVSGRPLVDTPGGTGYVRIGLPFTNASLSQAADRAAGTVDMRLCNSAYDIGLFTLQLNENQNFCTLVYGDSNDSVPSTPAMVTGTQIWISIAYRTI